MNRWAFLGVTITLIIGFVAGCFELAYRACTGADDDLTLGPRT